MKLARRLLTALSAIVLTVVSTAPALAADQLSAPDVVAVGDTFHAVWFGDRSAGDKVIIAEPDTPVSSSVVTVNVGDTNTIPMQAPLRPGTYDLRYVSDKSILESQPLEVIARMTSSVREPMDDEHTYREVLFLKGYQLEYEDPNTDTMRTLRQWCGHWKNARPALSATGFMAEAEMRRGMADADPQLASLLLRVEGALNMAGIDIFEDFQTHLGTVEDALCVNPKKPYFGHFTITYAHCRMTMDTPTQAMDIHMPPGSPAAYMMAVDYEKEEGIIADLARDVKRSTIATGIGWSDDIEMTPTGRNQDMLGHRTSNYDYEYSARMGGAGGAPGAGMIAGMVSMQNRGNAWVAPTVEGDSIPRRFYYNLATQVQPAEGIASYFSGLIMNMVGLMQHGLPLKIESRVSSKVMGKTMAAGHSESTITDVKLAPIPPGWCEREIVPPDFAITNISEEIDRALAEAGPVTVQGPGGAEMQAAMQEMQAAMEQMTPEQRQMMESMGLGDMMGMGAGAAGSGGAAAQQPAAGSSAPAARRGSQDSLSAALQGENLTETAKNYLQVLGYDTGEGGGEMNLETTIAISQFQAENGMEATGEVTPQLIGLLAAKVDAL